MLIYLLVMFIQRFAWVQLVLHDPLSDGHLAGSDQLLVLHDHKQELDLFLVQLGDLLHAADHVLHAGVLQGLDHLESVSQPAGLNLCRVNAGEGGEGLADQVGDDHVVAGGQELVIPDYGAEIFVQSHHRLPLVSAVKKKLFVVSQNIEGQLEDDLGSGEEE